YIELVQFLVWILANDDGAEVEEVGGGSLASIRVMNWDLDSSVEMETGELQSIAWSNPNGSQRYSYRFEGRHHERILPARYPARVYINITTDRADQPPEDSVVILYDAPAHRPGIDDRAFDWRVSHENAVLQATGQIEMASGEVLDPDPVSAKPAELEPFSMSDDPLADLKPSKRMGVFAKVIVTLSATLLAVGGVVLIRGRSA
ncbi:MAG: hypothetical protein K8E66_10885, partial [Phycisphaerales bacterium]|nr:hypothetical protein [Phycisphaerales bacterium]